MSNAGDVLPATALGVDPDDFARQVQVNLLGAQRLVHRLGPAMVERRRGDIVFVTSDVVRVPRTYMAAYVTSKNALEGLARAMQMELEGTGVRVGIVRPGPSTTEQGTTWSEATVDRGHRRLGAVGAHAPRRVPARPGRRPRRPRRRVHAARHPPHPRRGRTRSPRGGTVMTIVDTDREPPRVSGEGDPAGTGHLEELRVDPIGLMERTRAECGDVGEFRLADRDVVLLTGPDANEIFFRAPEEDLDQAEAYPFMTPIFGEGVVFDADPEERRKALHNQALRDKFMRGHAATIAAEVDRMTAPHARTAARSTCSTGSPS